MTFQKRKEFLFLYSVKDANPNGDPLNANYPRLDPDSEQIWVSDVRIKRTMRDQWIREGHEVFVDGEAKTLKARIAELKAKLKVGSGKEAVGQCLDTRLFGVTYALDGESFSWTGPVQLKWGRSLHKAKAEFVQGTAAFAAKEKNEQRSFRNEYLVPFALIGVYGVANQCAAAKTGAKDTDVDKIATGLWNGTNNLVTRSKIGHAPRVFLEITYQLGFLGIAGALDDKVKILNRQGSPLNDQEAYQLRNMQQCILDFSLIDQQLMALKESIDKVVLWTDADTQIQGLNKIEDVLGVRFIRQKR